MLQSDPFGLRESGFTVIHCCIREQPDSIAKPQAKDRQVRLRC